MDLNSEQIMQRFARIFRAARKLKGASQSELASRLDITQSAISKIESGESSLTTHQWFKMCSILQINAEASFLLGYIDNCLPVQEVSSYKENIFNIPKKYLRHSGSKVRLAIPFLEYFQRTVGEKKLQEYFQYRKIDPDFFAVYDNQINIKFALDLIETMINQGILKQTDIEKITRIVTNKALHGKMHYSYSDAKSQRSLFKKLVNQATLYESNFDYSIIEDEPNTIHIAVAPSEKMRYFKYRGDQIDDFICHYKKSFFRQFSTYTGIAPVAINERQCHFGKTRFRRCIYEITLAQ